jgi:hypothetical protein
MSARHVTFGWLEAADNTSWSGLTRTWTSRVRTVPFGATAVVASWHADTPGGSWLEVAVQGRVGDGDWSQWLVLARWADSDDTLSPTSVPGQKLEEVLVDADEVRIDAASAWTEVRARVVLHRAADSAPVPTLHRIGLLTSRVPDEAGPCAPGQLAAMQIDVPAHSQQLHRDRYPQYGGGQAWCSPTSVSMVLEHFGALPSPVDYGWVDNGPDRFVPHVARRCFDEAYGGTGNWSFNVAYAASQGLNAFVTRLRSLVEAEQLVAAGIPLVLSVSFAAGELSGAGYSTAGHLLTVVGFTADGDPVVNDPASHELADNAQVRTTYDRCELERAWLRGSGGITYVLHPPGLPLPPAPAEANW